MRWRTREEVISGKGDSLCGNKACSELRNLSTYEVNFRYVEEGATKEALVKVKCCNQCAVKLNHKVFYTFYRMYIIKKAHDRIESTKTYTKDDIRRMLAKLEEKQLGIRKKIKK
jgi:protein FRA10AC1